MWCDFFCRARDLSTKDLPGRWAKKRTSCCGKVIYGFDFCVKSVFIHIDCFALIGSQSLVQQNSSYTKRFIVIHIWATFRSCKARYHVWKSRKVYLLVCPLQRKLSINVPIWGERTTARVMQSRFVRWSCLSKWSSTSSFSAIGRS